MIATELPASDLLRGNLRKVYSPLPVKILTLETRGVESCGWYAVGGDPELWRYLSTHEGLWAERLSKAWQSGGAAGVT